MCDERLRSSRRCCSKSARARLSSAGSPLRRAAVSGRPARSARCRRRCCRSGAARCHPAAPSPAPQGATPPAGARPRGGPRGGGGPQPVPVGVGFDRDRLRGSRCRPRGAGRRRSPRVRRQALCASPPMSADAGASPVPWPVPHPLRSPPPRRGPADAPIAATAVGRAFASSHAGSELGTYSPDSATAPRVAGPVREGRTLSRKPRSNANQTITASPPDREPVRGRRHDAGRFQLRHGGEHDRRRQARRETISSTVADRSAGSPSKTVRACSSSRSSARSIRRRPPPADRSHGPRRRPGPGRRTPPREQCEHVLGAGDEGGVPGRVAQRVVAAGGQRGVHRPGTTPRAGRAARSGRRCSAPRSAAPPPPRPSRGQGGDEPVT